MRKLLIASAGLMMAAACGINEEKFGEDFVETYCEAYEFCDTSGRACPVTVDDAVNSTCEFDKKAARDCLAEDFGCDDTIPGFEVVTTSDACLVVCGQSTTQE